MDPAGRKMTKTVTALKDSLGLRLETLTANFSSSVNLVPNANPAALHSNMKTKGLKPYPTERNDFCIAVCSSILRQPYATGPLSDALEFFRFFQFSTSGIKILTINIKELLKAT